MPKRPRPTIHDVAEAAGVSKSLVSLVLRDAPNVSDEARAAVRAAARTLGYRPNTVARSLVEKRSHVMGLMISDLTNPHFVDLIEGASSTAMEHGYRALINTGSRDQDREVDALETLLRMQADGVVVAAPIVDQELLEEVGKGTPTVVTNRRLDSETVDSIVLDDEEGARLAVDHLTGLGHSRIAHINGGPGPGAIERARGYRRAMQSNGLAPFVRIVDGSYTEDGGAEGALQLLEERPLPTAVIAANDMAAIGALEVLESRGLRIPQDVSLIGFDDIFVAGLRHIGLTSVRQDGHRIGSLAVELLIERTDGSRSVSRHIVVQPSLTVRSTTGPPTNGN